MIFLILFAYLERTVWWADETTAFLPEKKSDRRLFCIPVPEAAVALDVQIGTAVKLKKSSYGSVNAPLEWYLTVEALEAWQGDDFEFGGRKPDPRWQEEEGKLEEATRWTNWESNEHIQLGARNRQM